MHKQLQQIGGRAWRRVREVQFSFYFFSSSNYFSNVLEPVLIYECFSEAAYSSVQVIVALVLSMKADKNIGNDILEQADVHLRPGFSL